MKLIKKLQKALVQPALILAKVKPLGGQAIIEGVMIKATDNVSMAVRLPTGKIKTKKTKQKALTQRYKVLNVPFIRGVINILEMFVIGVHALTWSANQQGEDEQLGPLEWFFTFAMAILLTIGLFIILPYYAAKLVFSPETILFGLFDGLLRLIVFVLYLWGISFMKDVQRLFEYHGAEHMAVHCYEHNQKLSVANVKQFPPEHPRCGTSLLLFVVGVSIILFSIVRTPHWYFNLSARILLIPVVMGISFELLKLSARFNCMKWLTFPGIWTQKITTKQPAADQIEVAISAVNLAKR
ncbi:hypothetical protein COV18_06140 [Candidatus Woesearchaeota archaeon CG10_big_fil_rev_8_21_14_0_10_37_12]|nr:MAG: hypothetical protein COV18_06140 [Candidatus Woesearchaeota archaeon CG10_big_fil_rev_8_21_14_0_10_37_12]